MDLEGVVLREIRQRNKTLRSRLRAESKENGTKQNNTRERPIESKLVVGKVGVRGWKSTEVQTDANGKRNGCDLVSTSRN